MAKVYISDISKHDGKVVDIWGWLYNKRSSGKLHFLLVRDGTGTIQCVISKSDVDEAVFDKTGTLTQESSLKVTELMSVRQADSNFWSQI